MNHKGYEFLQGSRTLTFDVNDDIFFNANNVVALYWKFDEPMSDVMAIMVDGALRHAPRSTGYFKYATTHQAGLPIIEDWHMYSFALYPQIEGALGCNQPHTFEFLFNDRRSKCTVIVQEAMQN